MHLITVYLAILPNHFCVLKQTIPSTDREANENNNRKKNEKCKHD